MVRCHLDGRATIPRRRCATSRLAEFELWRYLMETRHRRAVTVEEVSIWVPEDARALASRISDAEALRAGAAGPLREARAAGRCRCRSSASFPAETYPEAQEALLAHFESALPLDVAATPGYFVPAPAAADGAQPRRRC